MINIKQLRKHYGNNYVLRGINLTIKRGEVVVLLGSSGGGKSTLLRCINMIETPTSGEVWVDGIEMTNPATDLNKARTELGMVFQQFNLFPHMTVLENIMLAPLKVRKLSRAKAKRQALQMLDLVGLRAKAQEYPSHLSGGQKQRVALARAMMIDPEIIGYDEPTSALDSELRLEVEKLILQNRELGMTQIVVTHDLQFAENIADVLLKVEPK